MPNNSPPSLRLRKQHIEGAMAASGIPHQTELMRRAGLSAATFQRIWSGQQEPTARFIACIAHALHVPLEVVAELYVPEEGE